MALDPLMALIVLAVVYVVGSIFFPLLTGGAGYTPTPKKAIAEALALADLQKDEVFYDLGCGAGGVLVEALRSCDDVRGVEIEPLRWLVARLRARRARVILGDLFKQDISDADVIFLFQYRGRINDRIAEKIAAETRVGTRVVSYLHPIEGMRLVKRKEELFLYST